jgi:tRNA A37 threonylcarbamoyladenosine biosynthesis protein TsaE
MDKSTRFSLMLDALTETVREEEALRTPPEPALPSLASVLAESSPLPREAIFLGQAEDDLPVLLNLYDPIPGPILIAGDRGTGKTTLLQTIARAADLLHPPSEVQYCVVTPHPEEWIDLQNGRDNAGIHSINDESAAELLQSLVTWAHNNKGGSQSILLLIEDLEAVTRLDERSLQNLRWLLLRGSSRRVWLFLTLTAGRAASLTDWLGMFRTRLFSRVEDAQTAKLLTGNFTLGHLTPGSRFALREGNKLLVFWLPSMD